MESIKEIFRIGKGPSSSHTMGPQRAAQIFLKRHPNAHRFEVTLYGSLAATGKGHMTDVAIQEVLREAAPVKIVWKPTEFLQFHPNGMKLSPSTATTSPPRSGRSIASAAAPCRRARARRTSASARSRSITSTPPRISSAGVRATVVATGSMWHFVRTRISWDYLRQVWQVMQRAVHRGIDHEGALPGPLHLARKAPTYYTKSLAYKPSLQSRGRVFAYALAVSEENASGGTVATAPTCGASGVVPGVLVHLAEFHNFSETRILHALATAGIFGNIVKYNASISGAEVGCQGEVGVACAMASAATCQLFGGTPSQIEYAAEMGLEHHLGMTCDPVCGLVQIPCIERNAFAACRALDAQLYASLSDGKHRVSFDKVVDVMKRTGHDIPSLYKETSEGGLAKEF